MDYGFVVGIDNTSKILIKLLQYRENTELVASAGMTTVKQFFDHLDIKSNQQIPKPVGDLLIGSHGNDKGWWEVDLLEGGKGNTTLDELSNIKKRLTPREQFLPPSLYSNADGTAAKIRILLLSCLIGREEQFMKSLQEVIGGAGGVVPVIAPKHIQSYVDAQNYGVFEYLDYAFTVKSPKPIYSRKEMLKAFIKEDQEKFKYVGGTVVNDDKWDKWIPKENADFQKTEQVVRSIFVNLGKTIRSKNLNYLPTGLDRLYMRLKFRHVKNKIHSGLDEHWYRVVVPIVDPKGNPDPDIGPLLFNFHPEPGLGFDSEKSLADSVYFDELYFTATR